MANLFEPLTFLLRKEFHSRLDAATDRFLLCALVVGTIGAVAAGVEYYVRCAGGGTFLVSVGTAVLVLMGICAMFAFVRTFITLVGADVSKGDGENPELKQRLLGFGVLTMATVCTVMVLVSIAAAVNIWVSLLVFGSCAPN